MGVGLRIQAMSPGALILNALDILIVGVLFYEILLLIRHTRAFQLVKGIVVLFVATALSSILGLNALHDVLQTAQVGLLVAIPVVFQPELRAALERIGRARILTGLLQRDHTDDEKGRKAVAEAVVQATLRLARQGTGALIVLERRVGVRDIVETGVPMDALVSWQVLANVFTPNTPLHDGAAVIRGERIVAAGCFLPLSTQLSVGSEYGTRHRAAVGVSEVSDAITVVVSEETGVVSVAVEGRLLRHLDEARLMELLLEPGTRGAGREVARGG